MVERAPTERERASERETEDGYDCDASYIDEEDVHCGEKGEELLEQGESRECEEWWCGGGECGWSCGGCEEGSGRVQGCGTCVYVREMTRVTKEGGWRIYMCGNRGGANDDEKGEGTSMNMVTNVWMEITNVCASTLLFLSLSLFR